VKKLADSFYIASQSYIDRKVAADNALYDKENMSRDQLTAFLFSEKAKTGKITDKG
jgi:hypothetical protein